MSHILDHSFGKPAPPGTRTCDWCGAPGVKALEVYKPGKKVGTGQYIYPCSKHVATAKRSIASVRAPRKAA
jgi:hypothetical protein